MSETKQNDVIAYFRAKDQSKAIPAESSSTLNKTDTLTNDFHAGHFFDTDNFTMGMNLSDDEGDGPLSPTTEKRSFARWRALTDAARPTPPFQADPEDVSLTRAIDSSSPTLLSHCLKMIPFETVVIVKRAQMPQTGLFTSILRLEFKHVWITSIEWEDNDAIREAISFKYNALSGKFIRRKPDGSASAPLELAWKSLQQVA